LVCSFFSFFFNENGALGFVQVRLPALFRICDFVIERGPIGDERVGMAAWESERGVPLGVGVCPSKYITPPSWFGSGAAGPGPGPGPGCGTDKRS